MNVSLISRRTFSAAFLCLALALCMVLTAIPAAAKKTADEDIKITMSFAGDCTLGVDSRYNNAFNSQYKKSGSAWFLKSV